MGRDQTGSDGIRLAQTGSDGSRQDRKGSGGIRRDQAGDRISRNEKMRIHVFDGVFGGNGIGYNKNYCISSGL